jgi:hypothetical protein
MTFKSMEEDDWYTLWTSHVPVHDSEDVCFNSVALQMALMLKYSL